MHNFTPLAALIGGILIGLSSAALMLLEGRIAGIAGICAGALIPRKDETSWRVSFIAGLLAGGILLRVLLPSAFDFGIIRPYGVLMLAGLLVGFGTRLGNGCTSGHGVCGIGRLSPRSMIATMTFIASGMLTVYLVNHVFGAMR
ncbi:MAG TPA: YeeE/YedE family protein [Candidatus Binataceae bacterium]|nr:YeeE/YedE family protein [Candidatus Binataceae bacterium]